MAVLVLREGRPHRVMCRLIKLGDKRLEHLDVLWYSVDAKVDSIYTCRRDCELGGIPLRLVTGDLERPAIEVPWQDPLNTGTPFLFAG